MAHSENNVPCLTSPWSGRTLMFLVLLAVIGTLVFLEIINTQAFNSQIIFGNFLENFGRIGNNFSKQQDNFGVLNPNGLFHYLKTKNSQATMDNVSNLLNVLEVKTRRQLSQVNFFTALKSSNESPQNLKRNDYDVCPNTVQTENCGKIPYFETKPTSISHPALCREVLSIPRFPIAGQVKENSCLLFNFSRPVLNKCLAVKSYIKSILFIGDSRIRDKFYTFCKYFGAKTITAKASYERHPLHRSMDCDTESHHIRLMWVQKYNSSILAKLKRFFSSRSTRVTTVVITSTCLWYKTGEVLPSYKNAVGVFENATTETLFLGPDAVIHPSKVTIVKGALFDEKECEHSFRQVVLGGDMSYVDGMAGQRELAYRYGTKDGKHMLQLGNYWTVQRILNWMCNKVVKEHLEGHSTGQKICCV